MSEKDSTKERSDLNLHPRQINPMLRESSKNLRCIHILRISINSQVYPTRQTGCSGVFEARIAL